MDKEKIFHQPDEFKSDDGKLILRDHLAIERTKLANERTLFAYIRTSLYLFLGGFTIIELRELINLNYLAYIAFGVSIILLSIGIFRYYRLNKRLERLIQDNSMDKY